jgi:hypothetical protein
MPRRLARPTRRHRALQRALQPGAYRGPTWALSYLEPRAPLWQKAANDPNPLAAALNLTVVRGDPLSNLFGDVPGSVVPDQHPYPLACRLELLAAPRKEASSYPAHRATIDKAQPHLLKLEHIKPVAGDGFGIGVVFGDQLLEEAHRLSRIAPAMQRGQSQPTPPGLVTETHRPGVGMLGRYHHQPVAPPLFLSYSGSAEVIQRLGTAPSALPSAQALPGRSRP